MTQLDRPWGGAAKVYTTSRDSYHQLVDSNEPHKFSRNIDAFHAAVALGLRLNVPLQAIDGPRDELVNVYSIDTDNVLWPLISALHPNASGAERFELLMGYADAGIRMLAEEFRVFGNLQNAIESLVNG